jgi:hypothetical protein
MSSGWPRSKRYWIVYQDGSLEPFTPYPDEVPTQALARMLGLPSPPTPHVPRGRTFTIQGERVLLLYPSHVKEDPDTGEPLYHVHRNDCSYSALGALRAQWPAKHPCEPHKRAKPDLAALALTVTVPPSPDAPTAEWRAYLAAVAEWLMHRSDAHILSLE